MACLIALTFFYLQPLNMQIFEPWRPYLPIIFIVLLLTLRPAAALRVYPLKNDFVQRRLLLFLGVISFEPNTF